MEQVQRSAHTVGEPLTDVTFRTGETRFPLKSGGGNVHFVWREVEGEVVQLGIGGLGRVTVARHLSMPPPHDTPHYSTRLSQISRIKGPRADHDVTRLLSTSP